MTYGQPLVAGVILAKVSGSLSMAGSSLMIRDVVKKSRANRASGDSLPMTTRCVLGLSLSDLGSSFWAHFIGSWMMPEHFPVPFAAGTYATCNAQSFLALLFIYSGGWCNANLALSYYFTVCRQVSETKMRNWKYQLPLLGWPWIFGLASAVTNIFASKGYSQLWFCERRPLAWFAYASSAIVGLGFLIILFSMGSMARFVYQAEKSMDRFHHGEGAPNREKTLQVTKQGVAYLVAYLIIFIPAIVIMIFTLPSWYSDVFYPFIFPLQGLLNAIVYFRPKYVSIRRRGGEGGSRMGACLRVLDLSVAIPSWVSTLQIRSTIRKSMRMSGTRQSSNAEEEVGVQA